MKEIDIIDILNELPDDIVESANHHRRRRNHNTIKYRYIISTVSACLVGLICFKLYPRLNASVPESMHTTDSAMTVEPDSAADADVTANGDRYALTIAPDDEAASGAAIPSGTAVSRNSDIRKEQSGASAYGRTDSSISDNAAAAEITVADDSIEVISTVSGSETAFPSNRAEQGTVSSDSASASGAQSNGAQTNIADISSKSISYTLEKTSCPLPEKHSRTQIDPVTNQPIPFTAQTDFDGEVWSVTLAESCSDAGIISGVIIGDVLHLSVICLNSGTDIGEETVCFSLCFSDDVNADISEIYVERRDIDDANEFQLSYTDTPAIQYGY